MRTVTFLLVSISVVYAQNSNVYTTSVLSFAADLYREYAKEIRGNFLLCPLTAHTVLTLAALGGNGTTARELIDALHLPHEPEKNLQNVPGNFEISEPYRFLSANKIYVKESIAIKREYEEIARDTFKIGVENVDFGDAEKAADDINKWVENKTDNKIQGLVKANTLDRSTSLVMVNALYFEANWVSEFGESFYNKFYVSDTVVVITSTMFQRNLFNYTEDAPLDAKLLQIPFKGNDVVMTIILPNKNDGLVNLENNLHQILMVDQFSVKDVVVHVPRFKIESEFDVKSTLQTLGVVDAFTPSADFNRISETPVHIDHVIQKTFLEITEKGAVASSGTEMATVAHSGPEAFFVADHPFVFYLKHKVHGVFFLGRFCEPTL